MGTGYHVVEVQGEHFGKDPLAPTFKVCSPIEIIDAARQHMTQQTDANGRCVFDVMPRKAVIQFHQFSVLEASQLRSRFLSPQEQRKLFTSLKNGIVVVGRPVIRFPSFSVFAI